MMMIHQKTSQLPLELTTPPDFKKTRFMLSKSNEKAWAMLLSPSALFHKIIVLVGPEGSGKSHLASIWGEKHDALFLQHEDFSKGSLLDFHLYREKNLVLEDIDFLLSEFPGEENFFHLLNFSAENTHHALLLTARHMPASWHVFMPDILSRLRSLPVISLEEPDDILLENVLRKMLSDRDLQASDSMLTYTIRRMERSMKAAGVLVASLDRMAMSTKTRIITRAHVRAYFGEGKSYL